MNLPSVVNVSIAMLLALFPLAGCLVKAETKEAPVKLSVTLDAEPDERKARTPDVTCALGDGQAKSFLAEVAGRRCWIIPREGNVLYLYVKVNDPRLQGGSMHVKVAVTARDQDGVLECHYDSYLFPWKSQSLKLTNSGKWKTFDFDLPDAGFTQRCNGYDFRFASTFPLPVADVTVELLERKLPPDDFPRNWDLKIIRRSADRMGFAHGGIYWGGNGMTKERFEREMQSTKELGFGWVRNWPEWQDIEPEKGKFNWEHADFYVTCAKEYGLKILGMIGYSTMWAADAPDDRTDWGRSKYPPKNLQDVHDYVYAMVSRYRNDVKHWEGWNEANVAGFWNEPPSKRDRYEHYVAWQRTVHQAAKKADPDCVVLTGGFADQAQFGQQVIRYYENGLKGTFDAFNMHIYGADPRGRWTTGQLETVIKILRHFGDGDKKIWITETGWATDKHELKKSLAQQAEWAPWTFAVLLRYPQVERVFFYQLRDRMDDEHYGWFDQEFNPRPVVARWKQLLKSPSTQSGR